MRPVWIKVIGFTALVVFGAIGYIFRNGTSGLDPIIRSDLSLSATEYSETKSYDSYGLAAGSIVFGMLLCFVAPRWILTIVVAGSSAATVLTGFASSALALEILRVALTIFLGGLLPVTIQVVRDWFPQKFRGLCAGAAQWATQLGVLTAPLLMTAVTGIQWRNVFVFLGIIGLAALPVWIWSAGVGYRKTPATREGPIVRAHNWAYVAARVLVDPIRIWFVIWIPVYFQLTTEAASGPFTALATVFSTATFVALAGGIASDLPGWLGLTTSRGRTLILAVTTPLMMLAGIPLFTNSFNVMVIALATSYAAHVIWSVNLYAAIADSAPRRGVGLLTGIGAGSASLAGMVTIPLVGDSVGQASFGPIFAAGLLLPLIGSAAALLVTLRIPRVSSTVCPQCGTTPPEGADICDCGYSLRAAEAAAPSIIREKNVWLFQGRIGRASFLARMGLSIVCNIAVAILIAGMAALAGEDGSPAIAAAILVIYFATSVASAWFGLATQVKRWHDLDKSGWMVLLNFTLIAIPVVLIILACVRGTRGKNRYGIDPLQ